MARSLLGGLAVAAGTGVAIGFGIAFGRVRSQPRKRRSYRVDTLTQRLDRIENRVALAERCPGSGGSPTPTLVKINDMLAAQAEEIERFHVRVSEVEKLAESEISLAKSRLLDAVNALPAGIETAVAARVQNLGQGLRNETTESLAHALKAFEQSVDRRVSARIDNLESRLLDQSNSLADLNHRAVQADKNLEKLINAIELLCEKHPLPPVLPVEAPPSVAEDLAVAAVPIPPPSKVRTRTISRPQFTLAHVLIAAATVFVGKRLIR
jgi:uncharacterized coiled-coil protein SlyX